jgi:hypothetical protein
MSTALSGDQAAAAGAGHAHINHRSRRPWRRHGGWGLGAGGGGGSGDALSSYELGSGTISAADALGSLLPQATEGGRGGDRAAAAAATAAAAEAAAAGARADIVKLQEMLLLFNERLLQVEAAHR